MKELTSDQAEDISEVMHDFRYNFEGARDTDSIESWVDDWVSEMKLPTEVINGVEVRPLVDVNLTCGHGSCVLMNRTNQSCCGYSEACDSRNREDNNDVYFIKVGE